MWLSFALFGYGCLAVVSILDKYILSNERVKPIMFVFYSTIFLFPLILSFPFLKIWPDLVDWLVIVAGASSFALSLWFMYLAFIKSEVSHSGPLIGGLIPLFILVLSQIFLEEIIGNKQLVGIFLLSLGAFIISFQDSKKDSTWKRGLYSAMISAFFFSVFHVSSKYIYTLYGFGRGFTFIWGTIGVLGLSMFLSKEVRQSVFPKETLVQKIFGKIFQENRSKRQALAIVADKTLSAVGVISIQYAISLGSVTKVNALSGVQYGALVLMVLFLSRFYPRIFEEKYKNGEVARELIAVLIIAVGLAYLVR